ncbi:PhoPQ-activated pathogenicity-related protein [Chloropicon primus]|uniref:Uncharacterized protein n=1 Tax=Chloropicon primus TaxID=1764295 RepID=A0A5B8MWN7_9CHLO|nr:hypothetical protein A3770_11p63880 [Chloropicon primus]UPR03083.1 PhoPQ-activated pathogenicity-related protein [Chloropicon primus]|eukprot:QDZ23870.1 hypothetical protein A3770_11p63880 [Chloropicon primus]
MGTNTGTWILRAAVLVAVTLAQLLVGAAALRRTPFLSKAEDDTSPLSGSGQGLDLNRNLRVHPSEDGSTDLDRYMALPTPEYKWVYNTSYEKHVPLIGSYTAYSLNLTSQQWLTEDEAGSCGLWQHDLIVIVPHDLDRTIDTAMLWPTQGEDPIVLAGDGPTGSDLLLVSTLAVTTKQVVVALFQTPNMPCTFPNDPNPLNVNMTEDTLVAYAWRRYLDTKHAGDPNDRAFRWPSQVPITKAVVRAMDATQEFLATCEHCGMKQNVPQGWVIFGASKRGWASWLTAAVDKRVIGVAPVVFDLLKMSDGFHMWWKNYGGMSFIAKDYYNEGLMGWMDTPEMDAFFALMDPFVYKDRYAELPKLVISATGDEFFQVTDDHLWWDEMPGPKLMLRAPNADHIEVTGLTKIVPSLISWVHTLNVARQKKQAPVLPELSWTLSSEGEGMAQVATINVTLDLSGAYKSKPKSVHLRHSHTDPKSGRKDFRWFNLDQDCALPRLEFYGSSVCPIQLVWLDDEIQPVAETQDTVTYSASMKPPAEGGWAGFYIQFEFPGHRDVLIVDTTLTVNTQVAIVPDTNPFQPCSGLSCQGNLV